MEKNYNEIQVTTENINERSLYERFARSFDLLDSLYKNQGIFKTKNDRSFTRNARKPL